MRRCEAGRAVCGRHVPYPTPYMECDFNALKRNEFILKEDIVFCRDLRKQLVRDTSPAPRGARRREYVCVLRMYGNYGILRYMNKSTVIIFTT